MGPIPTKSPASELVRLYRKVLNHTPATSVSSGSPTSILREHPILHNKLYCDQVYGSLGPKPRRVSLKVLLKLGTDDLRSVKSHTELAETANGVRMLAKNLARATIQLDVKNIMIVTKARDNALIYLTREVVEWFCSSVGADITLYVDANLKKLLRFNADGLLRAYPRAETNLRYWDKKFALKNPQLFDLVVTLGGDGTVLYVSNLFQRIVPPVISFALGLLGFLTNFQFEQFRERMLKVIQAGVRAYLRMRFTCRVHRADGKLVCEQQVLNELVIDRGPSPYVTQLELYGDGLLLTVAQADGLIIATPTGLTAYSLSAGGLLVHPGVSAILVTPICPHTLLFRPILLPDGMFIKVKVPNSSRSTAWASFDGKVRTELRKGDYVTVQASPFPFPTVILSKTEYIDSVSRNLNWNVREQQKPFTHLLSSANGHDSMSMLLLGKLETDLQNLNMEEDFDINYSDDNDDSRLLTTPSDNGDSSNDEDVFLEDDTPYLPSPGAGLNTPPVKTLSFENFDERECFAHPKATISLESAGRFSSNSLNESSGALTILPSTYMGNTNGHDET